ncbi:MAG TPA: NUDIX domain-containing protein [Flavisolibacter sp.]|nr:NUDIX domain-containing protein [Flavisolibacter sp.]
MGQVKIKEEKILSDEHFVLKRIDFEIQKKTGKWETQKREVFDHGNAVTVLLYNKEARTVILTQQFRIATYVNGNSDGMLIETPAGLLEKDEAPEKGMLREIKEETGYAIPELQKVYEAYTSAGSLSELLHFYVAPYSKEQKVAKGGGLEEEGEELKVMELPFDEALQMIESGKIKDAKTIMLLQYVQVKGLL